ncbi:PREDICTED: urokinase plasminogen activator surface receptor-like [Cyprinodon variegatus]|uniref:urokinase plasminogen activator surface receptor-like n=1 Tax=Cyprinodon variegatus TaxID=28743 RepID=UPI0007427305|nr:PREDICTED: urokinase plasminogen activator surface receptor-like [Cyprinodon variegatus]
MQSTGSSKLSEENAKGCGVPEGCVDGSLNLGTARSVLKTTCCSTNLCNTNYPAVPSNPPPNGKKCYFCDGQSCNNTLNCPYFEQPVHTDVEEQIPE